MEQNKKYGFKIRKGIDDLESLYAFHGNSQGDTSCTNDISVYKASGGWMSFTFKCELTEEAINKEIIERKKRNFKYIDELTKSGEYGKEIEQIIEIEGNSVFDTPSNLETKHPTSSYSFLILDMDTVIENWKKKKTNVKDQI